VIIHLISSKYKTGTLKLINLHIQYQKANMH